ncbi:putative Lovastatin diketide synthase LovF [Seiridium cardinale]
MAENGARYLVFLSRSAKAGPGADSFVEELCSQGCKASLVGGSVTSKDDVDKAVNNAATASKHIAGVINLSRVLRDIGLSDMSFAGWNTAVQPKVQGTWNLHEAILSSDLDFFILFSSYGSIAGQWGQANYTAANTLLNAFVQYRHHNGLVASVIGVGVMGGVDFASQNQDVLERLGRICIGRCREDACHREGAGRRPYPNFLIKDEDFIALNRPFESLGMDSLVAMEVRSRLRQQVGLESSTTAITQNPSLLDLSEHVKLGMAGGD